MKHLFAILILVLATALFGQSAKGCTCVPLSSIESLEDLEEYDFIALVKVIDEKFYNKKTKYGIVTDGIWTVKIIELFKGKKVNQIVEYGINTSCGIGVNKEEEWIFFGKKHKGKIEIHACDRNIRYRESDGFREWGFFSTQDDLSQLRRLFGHPEKRYENETRKEYYENGQIEIEETYVNGELDGARRIWYPNGVLFKKDFYANGKRNGKSKTWFKNGVLVCSSYYRNDTADWLSKCFYPTGQVKSEQYFVQRGTEFNYIAVNYYDTSDRYLKSSNIPRTEDDSLFIKSGRIPKSSMTVHNTNWHTILLRDYSWFEKIKEEVYFDPDLRLKTKITYHENGKIASISTILNGVDSGQVYYYDKEGLPILVNELEEGTPIINYDDWIKQYYHYFIDEEDSDD